MVLPCRYIDGLELLVHMVALVFQLTDIVAAGLFKVGDVNIAVSIGFILSHGILIAVIEQEGYAIDAPASGTVDFVDEDAGQCLVLDGQRGGFAALDLKVMGRIIQSEAIRCLDLNGVVAPSGKEQNTLPFFPVVTVSTSASSTLRISKVVLGMR